jgi:hypothetical protein
MRPKTMKLAAGALGLAVTCAACAGTGASAPRPAAPVPSVVALPDSDPVCTALDCKLFDTPEQAFVEVLKSSPSILAVGEFHARKEHASLPNAARRFTDTLLPHLAGLASDIVIELWVGTGKCQEVQKEVVRQQQPVTQQQAEQTPNEVIRLGDRAKSIGIRPHALEPGCDDFNRVIGAGEGVVREMLILTARMTAASAKTYFQRNQALGVEKMIVTYSGAMHNDLQPDHACGEPCSFGKQLQTLSGGRYVELDLVVPEYIHAGSIWPDRVWYKHFDHTAKHRKTTLFHPGPGSYVLIFPTTAKDSAPGAAGH